MGQKEPAEDTVIGMATDTVMEAVLIMETMTGPSNHVVVS